MWLLPLFWQRYHIFVSILTKAEFCRMLEKVSRDPQMLVDIYVNYDCNPSAPNLFERMVLDSSCSLFVNLVIILFIGQLKT